MKIYTIITLILVLSTSISGCGGGGEDENKSATQDQPSTPTTETTEAIITTSDLVSTPEFNLNTNTELKITLPASPSTNTRYFINICSDFNQENDEISINDESCKIRTAISSQEQEFTIALSTTETLLIAQVWPMENGAIPINIFWDISESGNDWLLDI